MVNGLRIIMNDFFRLALKYVNAQTDIAFEEEIIFIINVRDDYYNHINES